MTTGTRLSYQLHNFCRRSYFHYRADTTSVVSGSQRPIRHFKTLHSNSVKMAPIASFASSDGHFKRQDSSFRNHVEVGGQHPPEKGRYHLYVCWACPWAHRTLIVRKLKGLEDAIDVSYVHPHMLEGGWHFVSPQNAAKSPEPASAHSDETFPNSTQDHLYGVSHVSELYRKAEPGYNMRFTVPVLWDKKLETIVSNESSELIRDLTSSFNSILPDGKRKELDLYPQNLRKEIDEVNSWVYDKINNGVYKSGFATTQEAYESNVVPLFEALDKVEKMLGKDGEFLVGGQLTEADIRLYTTIVRFDPVYHGHFKCNIGTIRHDYPNINRWLKNLYWNYPEFKDTTDFAQIKEHYCYSHTGINPHRIVPLGPRPDIEPL